MATSMALFFVVCSAALLFRVSGNMECEELPINKCAYAVSSSGALCVLEKYALKDESPIYQCQTSNIMMEKKKAWIESDKCVNSCGLTRMSIGMSTDGIRDPAFAQKFCSTGCQKNCPNLVDLYVKLAAGEDIYLPHVCAYLRPSRWMIGGPMVLSKSTHSMIQMLHNQNLKEGRMAMAMASAPAMALESAAQMLEINEAPAPAPSF